VLRHRIGVRFEAEAEGATADVLVGHILSSTVVG